MAGQTPSNIFPDKPPPVPPPPPAPAINSSSTSHSPLSLSREPSTKRMRGLSISSNASTSQPSSLQQRPRPPTSPSDTPDHSRRPSVVQHVHARQPSQPLSNGMLRSHSSSTAISSLASPSSPSSSPSPQSARSPEEGGSIMTWNTSTLRDSQASISSDVTIVPSRIHSHTQSPSNHSSDPATALDAQDASIGEFVHAHLIASFESQADAKLRTCASFDSAHADQYIQSVCHSGTDSKFDQLLRALGHNAPRDPGHVIDGILRWYAKAVNTHKAPNSTVDSTSREGSNSRSTGPNLDLRSPSGTHLPTVESLAAERKAVLAICILCRTLIEILRHKPPRQPQQPKLEPVLRIVYDEHFRATCMEGATRSDRPLSRQTKWDLVTQLLAVLCRLDFDALSARILVDLHNYQKFLGVKGHPNREVEDEAILYLRGLCEIVALPCDSEPAFASSYKFMQVVSDNFAAIHGQGAKEAYCHFLDCLLLSLPQRADPTLFDLSPWRRIVQPLTERISQLCSKPKYWTAAYPVLSALLCVSPYDIFLSKWQTSITALIARLRERQSRSTALKSLCRLIWAYLQRSNDTTELITKTLDDLCKNVFFPTKKVLFSKEHVILEPLVFLLRLIGNHNYDFCFRAVIFPLMHYESMIAKEGKSEQVDPDKTILAMRAFLAILDDLEKNSKPAFPTRFDDEIAPIPSPRIQSSRSRHRSSSRKHSVTQAGLVPKAIVLMNLPTGAHDYSLKFCEVFAKITLICDSAVGGQAIISNSGSNSTPKTPISEGWSFNRKEESSTINDERVAMVDLLHLAIKILPRCLNGRGFLNPLLSVLCTNTARLEDEIATSAGNALRSIAWQGQAQIVVDRYSAFVANYDYKRTGSMEAAQSTIESMRPRLSLYIKLLHIWIHELQQKSKMAEEESGASKAEALDIPSSAEQVDRVESQGLLFLASASHNVRHAAVQVLRLVRDLDTSLGQTNSRIINVLELESPRIMSTDDKSLSVAQRSLLERELRKQDPTSPLIRLCSSDIEADIKLWYKVFPRFIESVVFPCQMAVAQTRKDVCARLAQMQGPIEALEERSQLQQSGTPSEAGANRHVSRHERRQSANSWEITIEQWRVYLTFACKTVTKIAAVPQPNTGDTAHVRKSSKSSQTSDSFSNATDLFGKVIPLLSAHNSSIRNAAVAGLGAISLTLFRPLLEALDLADRPDDEPKKPGNLHQRTASSPRRATASHFRADIAQVYKLTSHFFQDEAVVKDEWILNHVSTYIKELNMFLHHIENHREYHNLRLYFCGLVEGYFLGVTKAAEPQRWIPFQVRRSVFLLMETWSGFAPNPEATPKEPEESIGYSVKAKDRAELQNAALSAMAVLCAGPLQIRMGSTGQQYFDTQRIMQWIHSLFNAVGDQKHNVGRLALNNVIAHNLSYSYPLERSIERFYSAETAECLQNYVQVVSDAIMSGAAPGVPLWRIITALLFTLSHSVSKIRTRSARLLRFLDEANLNSCKLQVLDISISDRTPAVYRKAQFEIAKRLATQYQKNAFHVISEFCKYFRHLHPDDQRNFVHAILPWMQTIELQVDPRGGPSPSSFMLLANLLEITLNYSAPLQHEVQALWQALATGPHGGNVKLILDVIIDLCLDRRMTKLVEVARQVIVFLSETPAGQKLIDALLIALVPRNMTQPTDRRLKPPPTEELEVYPYLAENSPLTTQTDPQQWTMSLGQLCLILLVDLIVAPRKLPARDVPTLLQAVLILWDHHEPLVQEQAREMLVHLIHELVISELDKTGSVPTEIESFVDLLREQDSKVVWSYHDNDGPNSTYEWSGPFSYVVSELVRVFDTTYSDIATAWGNTALIWGTQCPVRHLACRSLQIYRCIMTPLDRGTIAALVSRLSVTIADEDAAVRLYAIELIRAIRAVLCAIKVTDLKLLAQLFWTICSCLDTSIEAEYMEALEMLAVFLEKVDVGNPTTYNLLLENKPQNLQWPAGKLSSVVAKGCWSSKCFDKCLENLNRLARLPPSDIVGHEERILFALLANLPRFAISLKRPKPNPTDLEVAMILAETSRLLGITELSAVLEAFASSQLKDSDFRQKIVRALKIAFFGSHEADILKFQMGMLLNATHSIRLEALGVLDIMVSEARLANLDIPVTGSDFVSPLLRLLDTDLYGKAWPILDKLASVNGRPASRHLVEMSMVTSQSNRNIRKRFEDTPSFFGIPEDSGWSVPMPVQSTERTKANLNSVLGVLLGDSTTASSALPTPEVEFSKETSDASYFHQRSTTMTSDEANLSETNISELVSKLDTLDDFFDDDASPEGTYRSIGGDMHRGGSGQINGLSHPVASESFGSISSENNGHVRSFQGSYSSTKAPPTPRDPVIMSPSAFAASPPQPKRPGMHPRSITSPAVNQHPLPENVVPIPTAEDTRAFSDDEFSGGAASDGSFVIESSSRSPGSLKGRTPSFRNVKMGLKKLVHLGDSPEVPKVPDEYLRNPKSSEP